MCPAEEEKVDHLFIHHHWVSSIWHLSLSLMSVRWAQPFSVRDVVVPWRRRMKKRSVGGLWKMIPSSTWWCTWKETTGQIF